MTRWRRTTACERAAQWISLELDGELGRLDEAALARHIRRCDRCQSSSLEIGAFTGLLREEPPVAPSRAVVVVTPAWAKRRARATIRGGALALIAALAAMLAVAVLPRRFPDLINDDDKVLESSFVVPTECLGEVAATVRAAGPA